LGFIKAGEFRDWLSMLLAYQEGFLLHGVGFQLHLCGVAVLEI
jgi:hypothetical protein